MLLVGDTTSHSGRDVQESTVSTGPAVPAQATEPAQGWRGAWQGKRPVSREGQRIRETQAGWACVKAPGQIPSSNLFPQKAQY